MRAGLCGVSIVVGLAVAAGVAEGQTVTGVQPAAQRVGEYVEITGTGFGATQGSGRVRFTDGSVTIDAGTAYVWRDNYIRVLVPVGNRIGGTNTPIPKTPLLVYVDTGGGTSNMVSFEVITATSGAMTFRQLTEIDGAQTDVSTVLGSPNLNLARTKDAEIGDVNGDGWPDLLDNNSWNERNSIHSVLRINGHDRRFTAVPWEPLSASDAGTFAVSIGSGGDFFADGVSYDADFADLTGDRLPDLIHTAAESGSGSRIRLLINGAGGVAGAFTEETAARMGANLAGTTGCPDDLDHVDLDRDGAVDFAVTLRTSTGLCGPSSDTSEVHVFRNTGAGNFGAPIVLSAPAGVSTHDVLFVDANADGFPDVVMCNEWPLGTAQSRLFLSNANPASLAFNAGPQLGGEATSAATADFDGDGLPDIVMGRASVSVFFNQPGAPGTFTETVLLSTTANTPFYDFEVGDIDLDGWPDIVGVLVTGGTSPTHIWINNDGDGTFTEITASGTTSVLPGHVELQRLSADLLDVDQDGDLDLYVTGDDTQDVVDFSQGRGPNQLWENLLVGLNILYPLQTSPAYAGSAAGGAKVLVRLATPVPVTGLTAASFVVTVDGADLAPSAIVTGGAVGGEFWLLTQMPAKPDGCYPLQVRLASDPAIVDVETASLCYEAEREFDRALAIDRTGSMLFDSTTSTASPEKMEAARAAARFFVDLSSDVDKIGVTSFQRGADDGDGVVEQDELARTDFVMVDAQAGGTDNRPAARTAITNLGPDGPGFPTETSIGAGLRQGLDMLDASAGAGHERQIVLLTDGLENYAPYWADSGDGGPLKPVVQGASPPVVVHTVAVGPDADGPLLQDIATSTNGLFFNLYEGSGSYGLLSRLASVYKFIDEEMRGEQRFFYREGVPPLVPSGGLGGLEQSHRKYVRSATFYVPDGFESLSVGVHWDLANGVAAVELRDPDGAVVNHAPPLTLVNGDGLHRTYRIADPKTGWYTYTVPAATSESLEFFVTASGITDLLAKLRIGAVEDGGGAGYRVPLRVIIGDTAPVLYASVHGTVSLPDKTKLPVTLVDDGGHVDAANLDGIYGLEFSHWMPGGYFVDLTATGVSAKGEPFTRHLLGSFVFPGAPHEPVPDDIGENEVPGDPFHRGLALSFHVGSTHPLGTLDDAFDANIYLRFDAAYRVRPSLNLVAMVGLAQLTADQSSALDNRYWLHASVDGQLRTQLASSLWTYVQAGVGGYRRKGGGVSPGINVGAGGQIPLSGPFLIEFGADYHQLFGEFRGRFITAQLGVVFSWGRR